jgi:hypothetical protein
MLVLTLFNYRRRVNEVVRAKVHLGRACHVLFRRSKFMGLEAIDSIVSVGILGGGEAVAKAIPPLLRLSQFRIQSVWCQPNELREVLTSVPRADALGCVDSRDSPIF